MGSYYSNQNKETLTEITVHADCDYFEVFEDKLKVIVSDKAIGTLYYADDIKDKCHEILSNIKHSGGHAYIGYHNDRIYMINGYVSNQAKPQYPFGWLVKN